MQAAQLVELLAGKLRGKGYAQIAAPAPIAFAMFKQAAGFGVPKLVGVIANTDAPRVTFAHAEGWCTKTMGRSGAGLLLLAQVRPSQNYVAEALEQGQGVLGYGQVVCGVYDLAGDTYFLPKGFESYHMGWDRELFA